MMLYFTRMLMLNACDVVAYADANDANADAKMPNDAILLVPMLWC